MTSPKRIITSYRSGTPVNQICEKYAISRTVLYRVLHEGGIALRHKPYQHRTPTILTEKRQIRDDAIMQDRRAGMTPQTLAAKYSLTAMRIRQITQRPDGGD